MRTLKSLELTDEQSYDAVQPIPMPDKPSFPYGMRICFDNATIEKLGIDADDAAVDGEFTFVARAKVTNVSCNEDESGKNYRIEAQIEAMDIEGDDIIDTPAKEAAEGEPPKRGLIYRNT